jgi:hypothetical protein
VRDKKRCCHFHYVMELIYAGQNYLHQRQDYERPYR